VTFEELIGRNIRTEREKKRWTQEELGAELEGPLGRPWSRQAVSQAESGQRSFPVTDVLAISLALGCPVSSLLLTNEVGEPVVLPSGREIIYRPEKPEQLVARQLTALKGDADVLKSRLESVAESIEVLFNQNQEAATARRVLRFVAEHPAESGNAEVVNLNLLDALRESVRKSHERRAALENPEEKPGA
jgi:transcriptional regulator with XRE-family HTH domain